MKPHLLSRLVLAAAVTLLTGRAHAILKTYDITVPGGLWFQVGTPPFALSGQPTFTGSVTVDNSSTGVAAFISFSLTTGSHTWTLSEFVGPTSVISFDSMGNLQIFGLSGFSFATAQMLIFSNNTMSVFDPSQGLSSISCNGCVSFAAATNDALPEASSLVLLGLGLVGLASCVRWFG